MCALVEAGHIFDGDIRTKFVKSGFVTGLFCPTWIDYNCSRINITISETEGCAMHDRRVYETHGFGADRTVPNSFVLVRDKSAEEKKIRVGKVLLLSRCVVRGNNESDEKAFLQFMESVLSLYSLDNALKGRMTTVGSCRGQRK